MTRTRFAPSPTGFLHVGNLRNALFAYLIARHDNGNFILRIEDTNQDKYDLKAEEAIYKVLKEFSLYYDEGPKCGGEYGPYIQSERLEIYRNVAQKLVENEAAYYCFCSEETLSNERMKATEKGQTYVYPGTCRELSPAKIQEKINNGEKYVIRQKIPHEQSTSFHDLVFGDITVENKELEDQILIKSDGYPTYNFANVVDDAFMHITHTTRGCEYLASTPKYLLLYDALRLDVPEFVHLPLIVKKDGKLSKQNEEDSVLDLLNNGFLPEAILNYLAFLGWSPKSNQEFFSLEELVKVFDIANIHKNTACYDINKLKWFNHHYIMDMSDEEYLDFVLPFLEKAYDLRNKSVEWVNTLLLSYKKRIAFGAEIGLVTHIFFEDEVSMENDCLDFLKSDENNLDILNIYQQEIAKIEVWNKENIQKMFNNVKNSATYSPKIIYMPLRIVVSGMMHGIDLSDVIYLMGKEKVLKRLS